MAAAFPDGTSAILPTTVAQVERRLPAPGEIRVRLGMRVEPDDLIGQCSIERLPMLLDIANALNIEPRELPERMKVDNGSHVAFRDVIARRGRKTVLSPANGTIVDIDEVTGFATLAPEPEPTSLAAGIRGYVTAVEPRRSAVIETAAAVVQGHFGCGHEQWGVLRAAVSDPGDVITADMIDARSAYTILIGGAGITADALRKAQAEQVKGVIVGSLLASDLRDYMGARWPGSWHQALNEPVFPLPSSDAPALMVTEGFGAAPMCLPIFELLTHFDRQEAFLQPDIRLAAPEQRPRVIVPIQRVPGGELAAAPVPALQVGSLVRIEAESHRGQLGKVVAVNERGRLPSGVRTAIATVQIGAAERIVLPQSILHTIG